MSASEMTLNTRVEILVSEIHVLETEIRTTLRSSSQTANLSMLIIAVAAGAGTAQGFGRISFSALPVFLTVVALANLNAAIDVAQLAEQRDWLSERANRLLTDQVFVTRDLARYRRSSRSGISVNLLSTIILAASVVAGIWAAKGQVWFLGQLVLSGGLITLCLLSLSDFLSIRRRTRAALRQMEAGKHPQAEQEPLLSGQKTVQATHQPSSPDSDMDTGSANGG